MEGLSAAYAALHPEGVLALLSSGPDRDFTVRLRRTGFSVDQIRARGGAWHVIWIATRAHAPGAAVSVSKKRNANAALLENHARTCKGLTPDRGRLSMQTIPDCMIEASCCQPT